MSILLETQGLEKYFKTSKGYLHAVDGIDLKIEQGTTLGVVGESGCGKSTLGRTLLRMENPTSGEILYRGQDITKCSRREMKKMRTK